MAEDILGSGDTTSASLKRQMALEKQIRQLARQVSSQEAFMDQCQEGNQYIAAMIAKKLRDKAKTLEERTGAIKKAQKGEDEKISSIKKIEAIEDIASETEEKNPELLAKSLLLLKQRLIETDSSEDILKKTLESFPDYSLADDALEFLEKSTEGDVLTQLVKKARTDFNNNFSREIRAGKNMATQAREFAEKGMGSPTALRDLYRDITGNPRSPNKLFQELSSKFQFDDMETIINFLLHSLGGDLKAKGPSIPRGELFRLLTESRSLQAILNIYRFFRSRMNIIFRSFDKNRIRFPKQLTYELIAQLFMQLVEDRYPSSVKIIKLARQLGIEEEIIAQIIVFSQFRDAVRQVAPKLYRSLNHRNDILSAHIEALEELEDLLEEEESEYEEEEEDDDFDN